MTCPLCSYTLHPQTVAGNDGSKIKIEHCGQCGGTWFDPFETIGVHYHEIVRIAGDTVNPKKPSFSSHMQECPRCSIALSRMQSDTVPAGVSFFRCSKCRGIWATQRQLQPAFTHTPHDPTQAPEAHPWSVAFIPTIAMMLLAVTTIFTAGNIHQAQESRTRAAAQVDAFSVTYPSTTSALIGFKTNVLMTSTITIYGDNGYALTQPISPTATLYHSTFLTDLKLKTIYSYEIEVTDAEGKTQTLPGQFKTP